MCEICRMYICPPACPSYEGISLVNGRPIGRCDECGEYIYAEDIYFEKGRSLLCELCGESEE